MTTTPRVAATDWAAAQASPWTAHNEALRRLEAGSGRYAVADRVTAPPGSCADGASYIIIATATGAFAGKENQIATAVGANAASGWLYTVLGTLHEGVLAYVQDEDADYKWTGAAWSAVPSSGYTPGGTDVALADGGTGASLSDPNADRMLFWDDSAGAVTWLTAGSGLAISGTTITAPGGGAGGSNAYEAVPTTVPDLTDFATWRNQGTATATADSYGVEFTNDIDSELHLLEQNMPSTPFSYYMRVRQQLLDTGAVTASVFSQAGFAIVNSTSGRVLWCRIMDQRITGDEQNTYQAAIDTYSSVTTPVTTVAGPALAIQAFHWLRVDVTATDVSLFATIDGRRWTQIGSAVAFATYLNAAGGTADKFAIGMRSSGAGTHKAFIDVLQDSAP